MGKVDLPREVSQEALDFNRLISTLEMIDGEPVIVRLMAREGDPDSAPGAASIVGELRHQLPGRYAGHEFSVGSPYPDRYPAHLAGGVLFFNEGTFESATLTTFDGNDYFIIAIKTGTYEILVEGIDSTYP